MQVAFVYCSEELQYDCEESADRSQRRIPNLGETVSSSLLRERRLANALSQADLAKRLSVSQALISQWESGKAKPSNNQFDRLNEILGQLTSASEIATEAESQTPIAAWLSRSLAKNDLTATELAARAKVSTPTIYNILAGRAQNPQSKTITALEKALDDKFESRKEVSEASQISGIGELIDFNPYEKDEIPSRPGVYVLYDISQRPIYVGKARKISDRLRDHSDRFWYKRPLVETGAYVEVSDEKLRSQIETVLIQFLKNNAVINKQKTVREDE